ncbi:hypothetical protein DFH09DRAFT_1091099 [Mycena vulgaris]|nr:hypothetical protein DFH09DRAFT_1091099 [Mycena vulgaris]
MSTAPDHLDQTIWNIQADNKTAISRVCEDGRSRLLSNCPAHERTVSHRSLLDHRQSQQAGNSAVSDGQIADDGLRHLLSSLTGNLVDPYPSQHVPPPDFGISWNLIEMNDDAEIPLTAEQQGIANIASAMLHRYDELPASDDEFEERSDAEDADIPEPVVPEAPAHQEKLKCYEVQAAAIMVSDGLSRSFKLQARLLPSIGVYDGLYICCFYYPSLWLSFLL